MNQFGVAAVNAANLIQQTPQLLPEDAWDQVMAATSLSASTVCKCCPREAFIGLADSGLIYGTTPLRKVAVGWNGIYAIVGVAILRNIQATRTRQKGDADQLWSYVMNALSPKSVDQNNQMEVVLALWAANLI